jgi:hypothetical protein
MCLKENPENMYMDVGASLDIFTKGETNRLYTDSQHSFSKESCCFKDSLSVKDIIPSVLPISQGPKNLVYFGVFRNKDYLELLKILLASVKLFSSAALPSTDFLILTSEDFVPDIQALSRLVELPLKTMTLDVNQLAGAAFARLNIFDYPEIQFYEKLLYLDTDIIIQGNLARVFEEDIEDKLYAMSEGTIHHEIHGGLWFDFNTINKDTVALNSGILLFKASEGMRRIFNDINQHIKAIKEKGGQMPSCEDQAFINYHFIKENKYNNTLMEKYGLIYCIDPPLPPSKPTDISICHFVWPIGNAQHKLGRMKPHLTHVLKNYKNIFGCPNVSVVPFLATEYKWESGWIRFDGNGSLQTKWSSGSYEVLDSHTVYVNWAGIQHFLRFNTTYSEFISVRLGDLDLIKGKTMSDLVEYS